MALVKSIKKIHKITLFLSVIAILSIGMSPFHTKVLGLGWVAILLLSLMILLGNRKNTFNTSEASGLVSSAKIWLYISVIAYCLRLGGQVYHDEFNDSSNFNLRILVFAFLTYHVIARINLEVITKYHLIFLKFALFGVGFSAFVIALPLHGIFNFGTNQIPWAAGITFLGVVIQLVMNSHANDARYQILGWLNQLLIIIAILSLGVRGSYFFILWFPLYALINLFMIKNLDKKNTLRLTLYFTIASLCLFIVLYYVYPQNLSQGFERVSRAYFEISRFIESPASGANSSVGARLYMWVNAIEHISKHPIGGFGLSGTKELIKTFADESGSVIISELNQLHNEYLQAILSYGIIGLVSFLLYPLGFVLIAFKLKNTYPSVFIAFIGLAFLFMTSSLTNTNTYHNFFATALSLSIWLIFTIAKVHETLKSRHKIDK